MLLAIMFKTQKIVLSQKVARARQNRGKNYGLGSIIFSKIYLPLLVVKIHYLYYTPINHVWTEWYIYDHPIF